MHISICLCTLILIQSFFGYSVFGFLLGLRKKFIYYTYSQVSETCDANWVTQNVKDLEHDLSNFVFGQELATDLIITALHIHLQKKVRKKPLVLNFHGWTGGGKSYVAEFIVKNWYKKGQKSQFVKIYQAKLHFPLNSKVYEYQKKLQTDLEETVRKCPQAMFVFDEVDKLPPYVLDGIKPYLDYNIDVNGCDFRESIFIFITNTGDEVITNIALQKWLKGIPRENLKLQDFEETLKVHAFNKEGGFYRSDLIAHHVIDHVVPFLPLEKKHVALCVETEMNVQGGDLRILSDVTNEVMEEITFSPTEFKLYSTNGCKRVDSLVAKILQRERRAWERRHHTEF